jgi:hypothetical protein
MKRSITFAIGLGSFVAASALGISDHSSSASLSAVTASSDQFGLVSVENLTSEQRAVLQAKFRYWPASDQVSIKTPL